MLKVCSKCGATADKKWGNTQMCFKHYRISTMRTSARSQGKIVPTFEELERLIDSIEDFRCPHCKQKMVWLRSEDTQRVISLQHNHSGQITVLCLQCNGRHAQFEDDSFYTRDSRLYRCCICKEWKDAKHFKVSKRKSGNRVPSAYCKACNNIRKSLYS